MIKSVLYVAYCLSFIMSVFWFAIGNDVSMANYFVLWGIVNYLLWRDVK